MVVVETKAVELKLYLRVLLCRGNYCNATFILLDDGDGDIELRCLTIED